MPLRSIDWIDGRVRIIDQNRLPEELVYEDLADINDVVKAISEMKVRGAPLIGVTAALGLALVAHRMIGKDKGKDEVIRELENASRKLINTRPTAVNLSWAVQRVLSDLKSTENPAKEVIKRALEIMREDIEVNKRLAKFGSELIDYGDSILTHCNTGSLATVSYGTALGVIFRAHEEGKRVKVYVTETRPKLQGARLTMFELINEGIEAVLIPDTAVGLVMHSGLVNKVLVGADRILRDGTTYNKIGTYQIAILAKYHKIPFYVAAPLSTVDLSSRREDVKIEERDPREVTHIGDRRIAPEGVKVYNPAFDITPPELITAIITDEGVVYPPFKEGLLRVAGFKLKTY